MEGKMGTLEPHQAPVQPIFLPEYKVIRSPVYLLAPEVTEVWHSFQIAPEFKVEFMKRKTRNLSFTEDPLRQK